MSTEEMIVGSTGFTCVYHNHQMIGLIQRLSLTADVQDTDDYRWIAQYVRKDSVGVLRQYQTRATLGMSRHDTGVVTFDIHLAEHPDQQQGVPTDGQELQAPQAEPA